MAYRPEYQKKWYIKHREEHKARNAIARKQRLDSLRDRLAELKSVPCMDCGGKYPPYVMDFDHINDNKVGNVSSMRSGKLSMLIEEIRKCEVVCANCHRMRTHLRRVGA